MFGKEKNHIEVLLFEISRAVRKKLNKAFLSNVESYEEQF